MTMTLNEIGNAMLAAKPKEMTMDEAILMMEVTGLELMGEPLPEPFKDFHFNVIKKRLQVMFNKDVASDYVIALFALQCDRVAVAVLYAVAIATIYNKTNVPLTIINTFDDYFGGGFPTQEELHRIWVAQKVGGGNSVDIAFNVFPERVVN